MVEARSHPHQQKPWAWVKTLIGIALCLLLTSCSGGQPSISLAPTQEIIRKAIVLQVQQSQTALSAQLQAAIPDLTIRHIKVDQLESLYLAKLPTYHLQGHYDLSLELPDQTLDQNRNSFDIYLQRQREGKTWRWLKPEILPSEEKQGQPEHWLTYRVY
ncbi:hypothetical protein VB712_11935 [Spirulina sp. CCNP1310]|uniref:hypothetical protein n=1 Tax=Spirulina sp. CCNP1310 TaxID=3110249 RepID=UPI002B2163EB|nr:hypothetical protein [Spirulina sp. CCNP1310]MEA5419932.1 hypothetical protein [Spirulina sp. CCNP1310]